MDGARATRAGAGSPGSWPRHGMAVLAVTAVAAAGLVAILEVLFPPHVTFYTGLLPTAVSVRAVSKPAGDAGAAPSTLVREIPAVSADLPYTTFPLILPLPPAGGSDLSLTLDGLGRPLRLDWIAVTSLLQRRRIEGTDVVASLRPDPSGDARLELMDRGPVVVAPTGRARLSAQGPLFRALRAVAKRRVGTALGLGVGLWAGLLLAAWWRPWRWLTGAPEAWRWVAAHPVRGGSIAGGLVGAAALVLYSGFLLGHRLYMYVDVGADTHTQYWAELVFWHRRWRESGVPFWPLWTFQVGIGAQAMPPEPLSAPLVALPEPLIPRLLAPLAVAKLILASLLFYGVERRHRLRLPTAWLGAVLFAFNGYLIVWGQHYQMATLTVGVLAALYGVERRLDGDGPVWLVVGFALLGLLHPFTAAVCLIFVAGYALARLWDRAGTARGKGPVRRLLDLAAWVGLGVSLGAAWGWPALRSVLGSERGRPGSLALLPVPTADPLAYLTAAARLLSNDLLGVGNAFEGAKNYYEAPTLYAGVLTLFLVPQFFAGRPRRHAWLGLLLAVEGLSTVVPGLRSLLYLSMTYYHRELSLFFVVVGVLLAGHGLDAAIRSRRLHPAGLVVPSLLLGVLTLVALGPSDLGRRIDRTVLAQAWVLSVAYAMLLPAVVRRVAWGYPALLGLCLLEAVAFSGPALYERGSVLDSVSREAAGAEDGTRQAVAALRARDPEAYRIGKVFRSVFPTDPMRQGYWGLEFYASFVPRGYVDLLRAMEVTLVRPPVTYFDGSWADRRFDLYRALGIRYYLTREGSPPGPGLVALGAVGEIHAFHDPGAQPLAAVRTVGMEPETFLALPPRDRDRALGRAVVLPAGHPLWTVVERVDGLPGDAARASWPAQVWPVGPAGLTGTVEGGTGGVLVVSVPWETGWHLAVDDRPVALHRVNVGLVGAALGPGSHRFTLDWRLPGAAAAWTVSAIAAALAAGLAIRAGLRGRREARRQGLPVRRA